MKERDVSKIVGIMIHHSASEYGNADTIRQWHTSAPRNWDDIGYNDVILNCYPTYEHYRSCNPDMDSDGVCEDGREIQYVPAGAKGYNTNWIHICLIGNGTFSSAQLDRLQEVVGYYKFKYPTIQKVLRHCDVNDRKPDCPSLSSKFLRELL